MVLAILRFRQVAIVRVRKNCGDVAGLELYGIEEFQC